MFRFLLFLNLLVAYSCYETNRNVMVTAGSGYLMTFLYICNVIQQE